jgi:hypothetical protein
VATAGSGAAALSVRSMVSLQTELVNDRLEHRQIGVQVLRSGPGLGQPASGPVVLHHRASPCQRSEEGTVGRVLPEQFQVTDPGGRHQQRRPTASRGVGDPRARGPCRTGPCGRRSAANRAPTGTTAGPSRASRSPHPTSIPTGSQPARPRGPQAAKRPAPEGGGPHVRAVTVRRSEGKSGRRTVGRGQAAAWLAFEERRILLATITSAMRTSTMPTGSARLPGPNGATPSSSREAPSASFF